MSNQNIRIQQFILLLGILLFAGKVVAYWLTHSVAILTDALESTVNVVTGITGLYSLYVSARPRDHNHPYGHGKIELISASFEGALISLAGVMIIYEGIRGLSTPRVIHQLDIGIGILALSAILNFIAGQWSIHNGKKNHSLALMASGKHLQSDTWTTAGIIVGLFAVKWTGISQLDSLIAIALALYIIYEGFQILRQSIGGIMDEADTVLLNDLVEVLNQHRSSNWIDLHNLRVIKYGQILHLDCHLTVPWYFNVREAHQEIDRLDQLVRANFPQSLEMFVHTDDCRAPLACAICPKSDCMERQQVQQQRLTWTLENITRNQRHQLDPAFPPSLTENNAEPLP